MIGVVVDTNVLVSAAMKDEGAEATVLDLIAGRHLSLYISEPILLEYRGVLRRPKLKLDPDRVRQLFDVVRAEGTLIKPALTRCLDR